MRHHIDHTEIQLVDVASWPHAGDPGGRALTHNGGSVGHERSPLQSPNSLRLTAHLAAAKVNP
jgi:hypothetical protein